MLALVLSCLGEEKGEEIVQIDLRGRSTLGDYMVVASGRSSRQLTAMSEKLQTLLKHQCGIVSRVEGKEAGDWVLIDAGDVIVHIFRPDVRAFYQLEKLWLPHGVEEPAAQKPG